MRFFLKFGLRTPSVRRKYVENEIPKISGRKNNIYPPSRSILIEKWPKKGQKSANFMSFEGGVKIYRIHIFLAF